MAYPCLQENPPKASTEEFSYAYWVSTLDEEELPRKTGAQKLYNKLALATPSVGSLDQPRQSLGLEEQDRLKPWPKSSDEI